MGGGAKKMQIFCAKFLGKTVVLPKHSKRVKKIVSLYMDWELEIHNRINLGFALGWAYYAKDADHDWVELNIYLGLIGLTFKY